MMEKKKVTARPPAVSVKDLEMSFINDGVVDPPITIASKRQKYPWEETNVREDVVKTFNVRLSEPYFLKLKYISDKTRKSCNSICASLIEEFLDSEIERKQ